MEKLYYNGFVGSVEFSDADQVFFGRIVNITDTITFEADMECDLQKAFEEAADDYVKYYFEKRAKQKQKENAEINIHCNNIPLPCLTVGELLEKLNFAINDGYITNDDIVCVINPGEETFVVQNITLPKVILREDKEFKKVQIIFTKPKTINI